MHQSSFTFTFGFDLQSIEVIEFDMLQNQFEILYFCSSLLFLHSHNLITTTYSYHSILFSMNSSLIQHEHNLNFPRQIIRPIHSFTSLYNESLQEISQSIPFLFASTSSSFLFPLPPSFENKRNKKIDRNFLHSSKSARLDNPDFTLSEEDEALETQFFKSLLPPPQIFLNSTEISQPFENSAKAEQESFLIDLGFLWCNTKLESEVIRMGEEAESWNLIARRESVNWVGIY